MSDPILDIFRTLEQIQSQCLERREVSWDDIEIALVLSTLHPLICQTYRDTSRQSIYTDTLPELFGPRTSDSI